MRLLDILLLALVATMAVVAVYAMYRRKKSGKHVSCGGDCSHCAMGCAKQEK